MCCVREAEAGAQVVKGQEIGTQAGSGTWGAEGEEICVSKSRPRPSGTALRGGARVGFPSRGPSVAGTALRGRGE